MGTNCCVCGKKPCETRAVCNALWLEQVRKDQAYQEFVARAKTAAFEEFMAKMKKKPQPPPDGWWVFDEPAFLDGSSVSIWDTSKLPWGAKRRKKKRDHSKADRAAVEAFVASLKPSGGNHD